MLKPRILPFLVIVGLFVGVYTAFGALSGAPARAEQVIALPTPSPSGSSDWDVSGQIQEMNGEFWMIQGFLVKVTDATHVDGDVPSIGTFAQAQGVVLGDGTWLATEVHVGSAATPTLVVVPTSVPPTPSPTDSPVLTPSPTPTSSPTAVRVAAHASVPENTDSGEGDGDRPSSHSPGAPTSGHPAQGKSSHGPKPKSNQGDRDSESD